MVLTEIIREGPTSHDKCLLKRQTEEGHTEEERAT